MNVARYAIDSPAWGEVLVLRPTPIRGDPWGDLAPLRGTPWGDLLPVVSGEALSHALHGHATPLMREIGPHPHGLARKLPAEFRWCAHKDTGCLMATPDCHPGPTLPGCYVPPGVETDARPAAAVVAAAWQEGRYVIIVQGPEFSL